MLFCLLCYLWADAHTLEDLYHGMWAIAHVPQHSQNEQGNYVHSVAYAQMRVPCADHVAFCYRTWATAHNHNIPK
ncbi:hypothetical protein AGMMS49992_29460 [Clostridia bacterium]|nr:hypothetical protein AGMMS49992_29460 [Clostridia bacterium]